MFLAAAIAAELGLSRLADRVATNESFMLYRFQKRRAASPDAKADVVFVGDSTLRSSIDPKAFSGRAGVSALNLGVVSASGVMSDFYLLRTYLETHDPPRAVVMIHAVEALAGGLNLALFTTHFATYSEVGSLWRSGLLDARAAADALVRATLPSYRHKPYLERALLPIAMWDPGALARAAAERDAFMEARARLGYMPDEPIRTAPRLRSITDRFEASAATNVFMDRLLALAEAHGTTIYVVHGPLHREDVPLVADSPYFAGLEAYLGDLSRRHPCLVVVDGIEGFSDEEMGATANHLNAAGARRFSVAVAERLVDRRNPACAPR